MLVCKWAPNAKDQLLNPANSSILIVPVRCAFFISISLKKDSQLTGRSKAALWIIMSTPEPGKKDSAFSTARQREPSPDAKSSGKICTSSGACLPANTPCAGSVIVSNAVGNLIAGQNHKWHYQWAEPWRAPIQLHSEQRVWASPPDSLAASRESPLQESSTKRRILNKVNRNGWHDPTTVTRWAS